MTEANRLSFRPVQGTEEKIKALNPIDGYVYFAIDTKKIYCGKNGDFVPMGGNSGIYYGKRKLTEEEKLDNSITSFMFNPVEDIEGTQIPVINDLILNIPDGGFYRVVNIIEEGIVANRLAIAGGSSSGGVQQKGEIIINFVSPTSAKDQVLAGEAYEIEYEIEAKDSAGDPIYNSGLATWTINNKTYTQEITSGRQKFSIGDYLKPNSINTCILTVRMNTGGETDNSQTKIWYIQCIDLKLEWNRAYSVDNFVTDSNFTLQWTPFGGVDCTTHIIIDGKMESGTTYFTKDIAAEDTGKPTSLTMPSMPYGTYTVEMYLTSPASKVPTKSIKHEITFIPEGTSSTLLVVPYYEKSASQYDTLNIPFMVYDPDTEKCSVTFLVNNEPISTDEWDRGLHYWPYTLTEYGSVKLTIKSTNNEAIKDIELTVNKTELNIQAPQDYKFALNALKFSSNDEIRRWESNGIGATFSNNFDWINGGLKFDILEDGSVEKYIKIRQGTSMTVDYKLFENFNKNIETGGKVFKICFKATNCYDYEAPILNCKVGDLGLIINAQEAIMSSRNTQLKTQYYENSYIELELEIWPDCPDNKDKSIPGDRFIMFWVDGIPAGVKAFESEENFIQANPSSIVIGSDSCDIQIYSLKLYERRLSEDEHLNNFIIDAPSANKMIDRYKRNDIIENGDISYEKLVKNNPKCHAYLYEIPFMTSSKDDKDDKPELKNCSYKELYDIYNTETKPYYSADNVLIYVQGTSSAAYGVAAFNLRSEFLNKLTDKEGKTVDGWQVSDTAWPIDLTCTKVNVASCENVNNVVNQEWYNKFQPYHDGHRRKQGDKIYRDTMEFNTGVVFIKDNNKNIDYTADDGKPSKSKYLSANVFSDTINYTSNPYYKQYAIGNMGNDKKNLKVFHDLQNPHCCCVEIKDNQNQEHWMTAVNLNAFEEKIVDGKKIEPFYEFRHSVKKCKAEDKQGVTEESQKEAFLSFVAWMASCDPSPYDEIAHPHGWTGEKLEKPVTFSEKTFEGFIPPGYSTPSPTGITLAGTTVSKYAKTYTHDTKEYRIAKMLDECEDHLVMDSVVYHYLFIERHTMVDNVAKNTFWSTEDGQHWDLTKDYDNDTSDGNDNSGYLSFTYGMEFGDKDSTGGQVFNAKDSVWINFIHELTEAQEVLYKKLQSKGAWNSQAYLEECKKHQEVIPERCWIYDYFRKYIRPRRLGLDEDQYLKRLEGGKKVHQRTQYEKYQEFYINSKYVASEAFNDSSAINLRLNSLAETWNTSHILPVSYYIDCYASLKAGGRLHRSLKRIKRKVKYDIPIGEILTNPDDGTCYIYGAGMIQTVDGLSNIYPNEADFKEVVKLREFILGQEKTVENDYYNSQLSSVNISTADMLEKVHIQNCGVQTETGLGKLTLDKAYQLKELKIHGSSFTGLRLAEGCPINTLYLNDLRDLNLKDLSFLTEIQLDPNIYSEIKDLSIINCPTFNSQSYALAKAPGLETYQLNDINWIVNNLNDLVLNNSNEVIGISVLENLKNKVPKTGLHKTSLSGIITIDVNCKVDEFELYSLYASIYPNLIIRYTDNVIDLNPAVELLFKTDETDTAETHYRVLASGDVDGDSIAKLISSEGPLGLSITTPYKEDTESHTYTFSKYWINKFTNQKYYIPTDFEEGEEIDSEAISFEEIIPLENMVFYPEFNTQDRVYTVKFYDWEENIILQESTTGESVDRWSVVYNNRYDGPIKNFYYRDSSDLTDDYRWAFKGWSLYNYGDVVVNNPVYINPETLVVTGDIILHAHFVRENCKDIATNSNYFNFELTTVKGIQGYTINIKENYRKVLEGKITLPRKHNDLDVIRIGDFRNAEKITHIFCEKNSRYLAVGDMNLSNLYGFQCFEAQSQLVKVDLSDSIIIIGDGAFTDCCNLIDINLNDNIEYIGQRAFGKPSSSSQFNTNMVVKINSLPKKLSDLGSYAFYKGGLNITISTIPDQVQSLKAWTFAYCPNVRIEEFGVSQDSQLETIEGSALYASGNNVDYIVIGSKIINLTTGANTITSSFSSYGSNVGGIVIVTNGLSFYGISSLKELGFSDKWQESTEGGI